MKPSQKQSIVKPRDCPIAQLPGLSDGDRASLENSGIATTGELLRKAGSPEERRSLAQQLHIHIRHVNKWLALADLARIPSVGCEYCGLLLHSGVANVTQLAQMPIERLHQQILRLQVATIQRSTSCPDRSELGKWIQEARQLVKM